jgi:peroxiredoxin
MSELTVGEKAPDFTLVNMNMKQVSLKDFKGKKVILAFFPGAFTGTCTQEMCTLRDSIAKMEDLDAQILGISVNDPFSNKAFHEENALNFPLLSDYTREVVRRYGVYHEDFAGLKGYTAAKRSVFILDEDGVIRYKWVTEDPSIEPPYDELEKELKKL